MMGLPFCLFLKNLSKSRNRLRNQVIHFHSPSLDIIISLPFYNSPGKNFNRESEVYSQPVKNGSITDNNVIPASFYTGKKEGSYI